MPNALAGETSPYLLQHKDNPVDWRPWSADAFDEARRRDVPVFLSVGYSACYWCHVMEREVFEDGALARQMNDGFVCVKVDREQRPDVDEHYMTATQIVSGQGGWPMSVFLTPGGAPFYAGTYFPPQDHPGRPGFGRVMAAMTDAWRNDRERVMTTAREIGEVLQKLAGPRPPSREVTFDKPTLIDLCEQAAADYDPVNGGFGHGGPKFPRQTLVETLLAAEHHFRDDGHSWDRQLRHTLDAMADGGLRDHLGGGFHRYCVDADWTVPHFEIMLYDQAMLAWCYAEAYAQFEHDRYGLIARRCLDFVLSDMTDEGGAFYTALDAEVDAREGGPYLWTPSEVRDVLGDADAATFSQVYGLDRGPNFADPHGPNPHSPDRNVLFLADPGRDDDAEIGGMRRKLLAARKARPRPMLDTKIITSWNGLMIRAFAHAADVFQEDRYLAAATKAADWILRHHFPGERLARSSRGGKLAPGEGVLDDYAHLARGCTAIARAGGDEDWDEHAARLAAVLELRFEDDANGGYFQSARDDPDAALMGGVRRRVGTDSPLPSGNAWAAMLMHELDRPAEAAQVLHAFAGTIVEQPGGAAAMLEAAIHHRHREGAFTVAAGAAPEPPRQEDVVDVAAEWHGPRRLTLHLSVAEGFRVYPPGHAGGERPVEVAGEAVAGVTFPPGEVLRGTFPVAIDLARDATAEGVELTLGYQACDESRCLMPVRKAFVVRSAAP